ncbi:unnamed protein product [Closterium sp. NIES-64]|nr:unnamed protein product [Closterium sp. NIES-64]
MPPKGSHVKPIVDAPPPETTTGGPDAASKQTATSKLDIVKDLPFEAEVTAGSSGLSIEDKLKALATVTLDDTYIEDDSYEELEVDNEKGTASHLRFTAILLFPIIPSHEIASVIITAKMLMKRVWSHIFTDGVLTTVKFQELPPAYVAKSRYSRLQVSFLQEANATSVKQMIVDHKRPNGLTIYCFWLHQEDPAFIRTKAANPQMLEVYFKGVPADISLELVKDVMVVHRLKVRKRSAFSEGHCFHRVLHPVTGADIAASFGTSPLVTPLLMDAAFILISTGSNREEWLCTQASCGKAHGESFVTAADHVTFASHLLGLEKLGAATRLSLEKLNLNTIRKEYGI